jgi:hypothetical protein
MNDGAGPGTGDPASTPGPWADALDELARRRAFAHGLGGAAAVDKHHAQGRLTIR